MCPLVLRHKLDGGKDEDRAVYRYVFKCPGEAAILVSGPHASHLPPSPEARLLPEVVKMYMNKEPLEYRFVYSHHLI